MRHRIPPHLKETVSIIRYDALNQNQLIRVAEGVQCLVNKGAHEITFTHGVAVSESVFRSEWAVLLEVPNPDICEGDIIVRADGEELKVSGVRRLSNGTVMRLEIQQNRVP